MAEAARQLQQRTLKTLSAATKTLSSATKTLSAAKTLSADRVQEKGKNKKTHKVFSFFLNFFFIYLLEKFV